MLRNLGVLSLWMDEGFHYLAARSILDHGYPLFPSGHIYWKAILYAYVLAAGALVFGLNAVTMRVVSVLCAAGLLALAYHAGRRFFSRTVGVSAAVLLAFSAWEWEYARLALYFAPLQLCYLAGLYFFYRGYVAEEKKFKLPAVGLFLLAPLIHQLGMGVIFAYPALLLMRGPRRFFRRDVLAGAAAVILFYLAIQLQEFFFWKVGFVYEKTDLSLGGMIAYFFGSFNLDYFRQFYRSFPRMSLAVLAGLFLCLGLAVRKRRGARPTGEPGPDRSPWLYFNICLILPLFFFGFFRTHVQPRYLAQLYPLFILMFLAALRAACRLAVDGLAAPALRIEKARTREAFSGLLFLGLLFVLTEGVHPERLPSVINRRYGDPIATDIITSSGRFEHYDHESVGRYVAAKLRKDDLVIAILKEQTEQMGFRFGGGTLEVLAEGYGFLRPRGLLPSDHDIYVSASQIRRFGLRNGDLVWGLIRPPKEQEHYEALLRVEVVNYSDPEEARKRPHFEKLTPIFPEERLVLETKRSELTTRVIDLFSPIGKGQRALIVSPPKAGKTTVLNNIANAVTTNQSDVILMVLLVD